MSTDNTFFANGGPLVGVNLTVTNTTADFPVGTLVEGTNGTIWEYVQALSGLAVGNAVNINGTGGAALSLTALSVSIKKIGFAQVAITSGSYGWVARCGFGLSCTVAASAGAGVQLYTTATGGALDSTAVTAAAVMGVTALSAGSAGGVTVVTISAAVPAFIARQTAGA